MQEVNILNWPSAASANCNLIKTQNKADAGRSKSGYLRPISKQYYMYNDQLDEAWGWGWETL